MKKIIFLCLLLLNLGSAQDLKLKKYTMRDGLPTNDISGIIQDSLGYIWVVSSKGVLKYDGIKWERAGAEYKIGGHSFQKIIKDQKDNLWVFGNETKHLLVKLSKKNPRFYDFDKLKLFEKKEFVSDVKISYQNNGISIFVLTSKKRLFLLDKGKWFSVSIPAEVKETYGLEYFSDMFLVLTEKGIYKLSEKTIEKHPVLGDVKDIKYFKSKSHSNKELLFLLNEHKLFKYDGRRIRLVNKNLNLKIVRGIPATHFLDVNKNGYIFFGNQSRFYSLTPDGEVISKYFEAKELQGTGGGTDLFIDKEDVVWMATKRGINKIVQTPFSGLKNYLKVNKEEVSSLYKTKRGKIIIGQNGRINVYENNSLKTYMFPGDPMLNKTTTRVMDISEDSKGDIWFVADKFGIGKFKKGKINWTKSKDFLNYSSILINPDDSKIIGTTTGLFELTGKSLKRIFPEIEFVRRLKRLDENRYAVCSGNNGIYIVKGDSTKHFKCKDKYLNSTYDLEQISENILWAATKNGLAEINLINNSYKKIFTEEITEELYSVNRESKGVVWLGSNNGYLRYKDNDFIKLTTAFGLAGNEANRTAFLIDDLGKIWFGTDGGLSILDNSFFENKYPEPTCLISSVAINGKEFSEIPDEVNLPNDFKLEIEYAGLSFIDEDSHTYRLKLYGENKKLIFEKNTNRTDLELFALHPGEYDLLIWCINPLSIESRNPAKIKIIVKGDFYKSNWFYLILFVVSSILTYLIYYLIGQKRYANKLEMEVEKKTSELLEEIKNKNEIAVKLKKSEEKYRGLFDHSVIGIFQIDLNGKFITVNNSLKDILGYIENFNVESIENISNIITDEEADEDFVENILKNKFVIGKKYALKKNDESIVKVRCNARLIEEGENKIFIEGTFEDITQSIRAENVLIMAKQKAENSEKIKTEFLAQMSHEIRTPINVILSFSQLLKDEITEQLNEEYRDFFQGIDKAGRRIIRTIDLLLNVSELQTGGYDYQPKKIWLLDDIMDPLLTEYKLLAIDKKLDLNLKCEPEIAIFGDEYTIMQIFANLIDNAIKYTEKGSIEVSVEEKNGVVVSVKDSGIGITEKYLPELFSPFSQEEQGYTRKYEGNGLGLTLVKKYCELNCAEISVESEKGVGTKVIVEFKG